MIDLHTHSTFSDGTCTPAEIAAEAKRRGLTAIALTDHDTTTSSEEMQEACDAEGVEYICGAELSLRDPLFPDRGSPRGVHVLAYFVNPDPNDPFQLLLGEMRQDRIRRNEAILKNLHDAGFTALTMDELADEANGVDSVGRPHFANALIRHYPTQFPGDPDEARRNIFNEWLGTNGKAYEPRKNTPMDEVIAVGRSVGVVFSMAHPLINYLPSQSLDIVADQLPAIARSLKDRGFSGLESYYGSHEQPVRELTARIAREAGLIPTGGSDFHGANKADVQLGVGRTGDLNVPYEILEELRAAR